MKSADSGEVRSTPYLQIITACDTQHTDDLKYSKFLLTFVNCILLILLFEGISVTLNSKQYLLSIRIIFECFRKPNESVD